MQGVGIYHILKCPHSLGETPGSHLLISRVRNTQRLLCYTQRITISMGVSSSSNTLPPMPCVGAAVLALDLKRCLTSLPPRAKPDVRDASQ